MDRLDDNFQFFVDKVTLEKAGKDENGREIMKVGGIATTKAKDTDGEEIDEKGWDTDYFVNSGFFNYNHQSKFNPKAVIGEPTTAKVTKDGIYVEGFLYSDSDLAQSVYDTTKMLESSSSNRRMGFSIEGKALERDPFNPKKIKKARLTGCALTLNPKNPNTLVNILKGEGVDVSDYKYDEEQIGQDIEKSEEYLVCLEKNGKKVQIDKDLNIKITDIDKKIEKSISTVSASAVLVEDVDQNTKNRIAPDEGSKKLTKGEVYSEIFDYIYSVDLEKAEMMFNIIEATATKRIQMKNNIDNVENPNITKDDLQKSLDLVMGVVSSNDTLTKGKTHKGEGSHDGEMSYEDKMYKAQCEDEEYQALKKACDSSKKALEEYEGKIEKGEVSGYPATPASKSETMIGDENAASIGKEGSFIKKGEQEPEEGKPEGEEEEDSVEKGKVHKSMYKGLKKSMDDDLGDDSLIKSVGVMIDSSLEKGFSETHDLIKSLAQVAQGLVHKNDDLEKGLETQLSVNDELRKSLSDTLEAVERIGNTPIPSKTVTSQNYQQHPSLEKSMDGGSNQLHAVRDKQQILEIMDRRADLDSQTPNMRIAKAMMHFESNGVMEKSIHSELLKSEGVDIVGI